ncbi:hypothetical protein O9993_11485 [Vibrio lentus]|nr:hypothetical protein [Vibrio lentus]
MNLISNAWMPSNTESNLSSASPLSRAFEYYSDFVMDNGLAYLKRTFRTCSIEMRYPVARQQWWQGLTSVCLRANIIKDFGGSIHAGIS